MADIPLNGTLAPNGAFPIAHGRDVKSKVIVWDQTKGWSDIVYELNQEGGAGRIQLTFNAYSNGGSGNQFLVTSNYDLSQVSFTSNGSVTNQITLEFAAGLSMVDLDGNVSLYGDGTIRVLTHGAIAPSGARILGECAKWEHDGSDPAVDNTRGGLNLRYGGNQTNGNLRSTGTAPVFTMSGSAHFQVEVEPGATIGNNAFGGTGGNLVVSTIVSNYGYVFAVNAVQGNSVTISIQTRGAFQPPPGNVGDSTTLPLGGLLWDPRRGLSYSNRTIVDTIIAPLIAGPQERTSYFESLFSSVVTRFVRNDGDDTAGDGLTAATAYATIQRALEDVVLFPQGSFRIDVTGYTATLQTMLQLPAIPGAKGITLREFGTTATALCGAMQRADLEIYAEPTLVLAIPNGTYTSETDVDTYLSTLTVTGASWTANQYRGMYLTAVDGTQCCIYKNTTDTLYLTTQLYMPTQDFNIVQASCTITINGSSPSSASGLFGTSFNGVEPKFTLSISGIQSQDDGSGYTGGMFFGTMLPLITAALCQADAWGPLGNTSSPTVFYANACFFGRDGNTVSGNIGISGATLLMNLQNSVFINSAASADDGKFIMGSCYSEGCDEFGTGYYHGTGVYKRATCDFFGCLLTSTVRFGIRLIGGTDHHIAYCKIVDCTYGGMSVERNATCIIDGNLTGTGNGFGLRIFDRSSVMLCTQSADAPLDATRVSITGTLGDIIVNANPARTWADFFDVNSFPYCLEHSIDGHGGQLWYGGYTGIAPNSSTYGAVRVQANAAVAKGQVLKASSVADRYEPLLQVTNSDGDYKKAGVAITAASAAGDYFWMRAMRGQTVTYALDAAAVTAGVTPGTDLYLSLASSSDGLVTTTSTGAWIGVAQENNVSAFVKGSW